MRTIHGIILAVYLTKKKHLIATRQHRRVELAGPCGYWIQPTMERRQPRARSIRSHLYIRLLLLSEEMRDISTSKKPRFYNWRYYIPYNFFRYRYRQIVHIFLQTGCCACFIYFNSRVQAFKKLKKNFLNSPSNLYTVLYVMMELWPCPVCAYVYYFHWIRY